MGKRNSSTVGSVNVPFSVLFKDTVVTHGMLFAFQFYVDKNKMPEWEFHVWCLSAGV